MGQEKHIFTVHVTESAGKEGTLLWNKMRVGLAAGTNRWIEFGYNVPFYLSRSPQLLSQVELARL